MLKRRLNNISHYFKRSISTINNNSSFSFSSSSSSSSSSNQQQQTSSFTKINLQGIGNKISGLSTIDPNINNKHYDVAIIGGGSAGLAFCFEASKLGLKTIVFDYVEPTPRGTSWGLGGTCVNVGCIPKKLMHTASLHKESILAARDFGWHLDGVNDPEENNHEKDKLFESFKWNKLVKNVQTYIKSLNFGYRSTLAQENIDYVNAMATLKDNHTLVFSSNQSLLHNYILNSQFDDKQMGKITADFIIIAAGGRPNILNEKQCKNGSVHAITSDDIFSLKNPPNKTLVVGGGYIALECAGFLRTLGYPVTLMNRTTTFLRGFDRDTVDMLMNYLEFDTDMRIIPNSLPYHVEKKGNGKLEVKWRDTVTKKEGVDEFDTLLMAVGRTANTSKLRLDKIGVQINPKNSKIKGGFNDEYEQTSIENIFALGDNLDNVPELTPVAQKSAALLAHRLLMRKNGEEINSKKYKELCMDYKDFPTTVFTPIEYSCCGYSEDQAIKKFGEENIEVYHSRFIALEDSLSKRTLANGEPHNKKVYTKIICDKTDDNRIVGIHYLGPNAGEVMQGYAVAMKMGMKKRDLDRTVGIHPTQAEEFVLLKKTKASGAEFDKTGC